jgi:ABC-2 type transport system ATP-binding protein
MCGQLAPGSVGSVAPVLSAVDLTKRFGDVTAVRDLSFDVDAGSVVGFLGPNGAGKTTTLRMLLGLARPTHGRALVFGRPFAELDRPGTRVGAVLEPICIRGARDTIICGFSPPLLPCRRAEWTRYWRSWT